MGKNDHIKNINMKVAGTLGSYLDQKVNIITGVLMPTEAQKKAEEDKNALD